MHWFDSNYNNNACQSKYSSNSASVQEKGKIRNETNFCTKISAKSNFTPNNFVL